MDLYQGPEAPILMIDQAQIVRNVGAFKDALPEVDIHFAVKCNPHPAVLNTLVTAQCGFEVASVSELMLLRELGVDPASVLFSNPVRSRAELEAAFHLGAWRFSVDSMDELVKVAEVAPGSSVYARLGTATQQSVVPSEGKFGASRDECVDLLLAASALGVEPYGLTFHVGSQTVDPRAWDSPIGVAGTVMSVLRESGVVLKMLNIGGGFPAKYTQEVPSLSDFGTQINEHAKLLPYAVGLVAEPGRALVATAGVMRCRILGVARRRGRTWLHTNLGVFNGMMEVLESGGELQFPVRDLRSSSDLDQYQLTGPTCDSQDTFAHDVWLSRGLREGDELFVGSTGAYSNAYASAFNGFPVPHVRAASEFDIQRHEQLFTPQAPDLRELQAVEA